MPLAKPISKSSKECPRSVKFHGQLIADGDEDGDEDELNMWEERMAELQNIPVMNWQNQG